MAPTLDIQLMGRERFFFLERTSTMQQPELVKESVWNLPVWLPNK